ncbi:MAG: hypothetical protein GYB68_07860 [Chloroflexi bacterium]|nr:hypothetical protein [Chloroflexota bacterium]
MQPPLTNRAVDFSAGRLFVVTDLHGEWDPYQRYRDYFLELYHHDEADVFLLLGDLIHGRGDPDEDYSLAMVLDVMQLQQELGHSNVVMLLGNHELPHIYHILLAKGRELYTPRFEYALGDYRTDVLAFFDSLPFVARTAGGLLFTHAGPHPGTATEDVAAKLLNFSHDELKAVANELIANYDIMTLVSQYLGWSEREYQLQAQAQLAVPGPDDERYLDLLQGVVVSHLDPEWSILWDFFFTRCEEVVSPPNQYAGLVRRFLRAYSASDWAANVLVTGHINVDGGYKVLNRSHLRMASYSHARPPDEGHFLFVEADRPIQDARELTEMAYRIP